MATKKKTKAKAAKKPAKAPMGPRANSVATDWVEENALRVAAAASIPTPIPGAHTVLTTALEAYMIISIGRIYGRSLSAGEAVALLPTLGGAIVVGQAASSIAGEILGWVPIIGWAAKGAASGATAYAVGKAAIAYFENEAPDTVASDFEMISVKKFVTDFFANSSLVKKARGLKVDAPSEDEDEDEDDEETEEDEEAADEEEDEPRG